MTENGYIDMIRFGKKILQEQTASVGHAAFLIASTSLFSRMIGLWRDRALASMFGAGFELDAYIAAFRIPDVLFNLLILGAFSAGFIPVFTELLEVRGKEAAIRLAEQVFTVIGALLILFCLLFTFLAPILIPLITPGFGHDQQNLTVGLSRIMIWSPLFLGLSAVVGGVLQATKRFLVFSIAPIFYNLGILLGIILFSSSIGIAGAAVGVVLGASAHFFLQYVVARELGVRQLVWPTWREEAFQRLFRLMGPRMAGIAISQLNLFFLLALASSMPTGSVALFQLATNVQSVPVGLIGISFAIAAFPVLSQAAAARNGTRFFEVCMRTARRIIFFVLPLAALMILLRQNLARVLFFGGQFGESSVIRIEEILLLFIPSLIFQCLTPTLIRAFYAKQNTWIPFWIGFAAEAANFVLALLFRGHWSILGLALAFSIAAMLQCAGLMILLMRGADFGFLAFRNFFFFLFKVSFSALFATGVVVLIRSWFTAPLLMPLFSAVWQMSLQGGIGMIAFLAAGRAFRIAEADELVKTAFRYLHR